MGPIDGYVDGGAMSALSLVVAVYKRPDLLERVLVSLAGQTFTDYEVVIADDGSGAEIGEIVDRYRTVLDCDIRRVWHADDGFRKTIIVNRAALDARTDYLVFIDGDCLLHHRFLERHMHRRRRGRVLVGRRVMFDGALTDRVTLDDIRSRRIERVAYWWNHAGKNDRRNGFYAPLMDWFRNRSRADYQILGSNFSVYRDDFLRVNGYDERIVGRGLEDNNLCTRFLNSGLEMCSVRYEALQYHCFHASDPFAHTADVVERFRSIGEARTRHGIVKE